MTRTQNAAGMPATAPLATKDKRPFWPLRVLPFIGSGFAALIYEVIWLKKVCVEFNGTASPVLPGRSVF